MLRALVFILSLVIIAPSYAETSQKDVMIVVRTFSFLANPPTGMVDLAVVYDPSKPTSVEDKENVYLTIDGGTQVGSILVRSIPVPITDIDTLRKYHFILFTSDLDIAYVHEVNSLISDSTVTMSTNLTYVREGDCVLGVISEPKVRILVNSLALKKANLQFLTTFRMIVTEVSTPTSSAQ